MDAARREATEEVGIPPESAFLPLQSRCTVPVVGVSGEFTWGEHVYVVPEYCYGVEATQELSISKEHSEFRWVAYDEARSLLKWDSNRNALWELNERLTRQAVRPASAPDWVSA
jgi:dATP pyrophosphohydrolase